MMAPLRSGNFHQSVRPFQTTKSTVGGDSNGARKSQWRITPRLVDAVPASAKDRRGPREQPSSGNSVRSRLLSQGSPSNEQDAFKGTIDARHGPSRKYDLTIRSSHSTKALGNGGETTSMVPPPPYQLNSPTYRDGSARQTEATTGRPVHRQSAKPVLAQVGSNGGNAITVNTPQPDLHDNSHGQHINTTLPTPNSVRPDSSGLRNKNTVRQGLRYYNPGRPAAIEVGRHETKSRDSKTISGTGSQRAVNNTFASPGRHPRKDSRDQGVPRLTTATGNASLGLKDSTSNGPASAQSSGVAGEIWVDTLSLRNWLHAYLTGEIGRASRAQAVLPD